MSAYVWGFGWAVAALVTASILHRFLPRHLAILLPVALGYLLGPGGFGWLREETSGLAVPLALALGAGWIGFAAARTATSTLRRSASRSGVTWAIAFTLIAPSCLAGALSPIVVSAMGPAGMALPALTIVVAAAILADPSVFKDREASRSQSAPLLAESRRIADSFHATALLIWPAYFAVARALASAEELSIQELFASLGLSYGMGIGLGIAGIVLLKRTKAPLLIAAAIFALALGGALLSSLMSLSVVATCFLAGAIAAQQAPDEERLFEIARRLGGPFRFLFLAAAGAATPRWEGLLVPLVVFGVVLGGRPFLGLFAGGFAGSLRGAAGGRRLGWLLCVPSPLAIAMVVEAYLVLGHRLAGPDLGAVRTPPGAFATHWQEGSHTPLAAFLLATIASDLLGRLALTLHWRKAAGRADDGEEAAVAEGTPDGARRHHHHGHHHGERRHRGRPASAGVTEPERKDRPEGPD